MSQHAQTNNGFHVNRNPDNPIDALHEAAAVAEMLEVFVAGCSDLHMFDGTNSNNHSMDGLSIILGGISDTITDAVAALDHCEDEAEEDAASVDDVKKVLGRPVDELPTMGELVTATMRENMTAREAAIAAVGYELEDIAKAVSLKKITVQRIIGQLDGKTAPAPDPVEHGTIRVNVERVRQTAPAPDPVEHGTPRLDGDHGALPDRERPVSHGKGGCHE